jgi:hypothetical protein
MLRHACGYALANTGHNTRRIQDWLRHRSIQHTTRYTQLNSAPFFRGRTWESQRIDGGTVARTPLTTSSDGISGTLFELVLPVEPPEPLTPEIGAASSDKEPAAVR